MDFPIFSTMMSPRKEQKDGKFNDNPNMTIILRGD